MYRTDKQFMKDPATASSRIYIGNIAEPVVAPDLEERFKIHGKILGLVLQRGFGFIQFEHDGQAKTAIRNEHGALFFGRKLNVKQAVDKSRLNASQGGPPQQNQQQHQQQGPRGPQPLLQLPQQPPPLQKQQQPPQQKPQPPQQQQSPRGPPVQLPPKREATPPPQQPTPPQPKPCPPPQTECRFSPPPKQPSESPVEKMDTNENEDKDRPHDVDMDSQNSRPFDMNSDTSERRRRARRGGIRNRERDRHDRYSDDFNFPYSARDMPPRDLPPRDLPPRDMPPYYGREDHYRPAPGFIPPPIMDRPERNDCEIIVVSKVLTEYAEYIEKRLKSVGLTVDLLFPNEDVPIGRVLANISSRGCLYAILVMPQNEEYRSMTLSILHGTAQEHRNMPVDDAITLITRNFDAYMRGEKLPGSSSGSITDRHPEQIQMLFNLLAENRQITTIQYDRLLKYLQDRRELQKEFEVSEGVGEGNAHVEPNSKQAELQSRIMNILNKSADDVPKPVEAPPPQPPGPTPLLNDPSVQKALDSLLSGEMFKTISTPM